MKEQYNTENFYLAVWLTIKGLVPKVTYLKQNPDEQQKATFFFDLTEKQAKVHIQEFYQDEVVQEFIEGIKRLKSELYANKEPKVY